MLNYHHLRYFWIVAHEGNLARAAEKIHIAQSALSMQIRKLEEDLKQPLFERQGRGLVLTEAGRIALDFADSIFATGDELLGTLGELDQPHRRVLRVGALATLSRNFQLQFLAPLLTQGEIEVVVRSGRSGSCCKRWRTTRSTCCSQIYRRRATPPRVGSPTPSTVSR
ncbi:MAG: LysR family transcriptional regulator [Caldilineaceae bacterium]